MWESHKLHGSNTLTSGEAADDALGLAAGKMAAHGNTRIYVAFTSMPQNIHTAHMPASVFTSTCCPTQRSHEWLCPSGSVTAGTFRGGYTIAYSLVEGVDYTGFNNKGMNF